MIDNLIHTWGTINIARAKTIGKYRVRSLGPPYRAMGWSSTQLSQLQDWLVSSLFFAWNKDIALDGYVSSDGMANVLEDSLEREMGRSDIGTKLSRIYVHDVEPSPIGCFGLLPRSVKLFRGNACVPVGSEESQQCSDECEELSSKKPPLLAIASFLIGSALTFIYLGQLRFNSYRRREVCERVCYVLMGLALLGFGANVIVGWLIFRP